jgi:hypothetical protein
VPPGPLRNSDRISSASARCHIGVTPRPRANSDSDLSSARRCQLTSPHELLSHIPHSFLASPFLLTSSHSGHARVTLGSRSVPSSVPIISPGRTPELNLSLCFIQQRNAHKSFYPLFPSWYRSSIGSGHTRVTSASDRPRPRRRSSVLITSPRSTCSRVFTQ